MNSSNRNVSSKILNSRLSNVMSQDPYPDHKLCGFLCTVLRAPPEIRPDSEALEFGTRCDSFSNGFPLGLRSEFGIVLIPVVSSDSSQPEIGDGGSGVVEGSGELKGREDEAVKRGRKKNMKGMEMKKRSKVGIGQGSMSVVHQLHVLVMQKCLKITARVVRVVLGENEGEFRVVVLVDVYLPTQVWSGWQFPKSSSTD